jgi:hypothetical protein
MYLILEENVCVIIVPQIKGFMAFVKDNLITINGEKNPRQLPGI